MKDERRAPWRASAILCTHNGAARIEETLEALIRQDLPPDAFEILVVDNASSDATPEVLRRAGARHPGRIRVVREPVLGLSQARNRAIRESRGGVIAFSDDDARPSPRWLRALVETCERPEVGCAGGPVQTEGELPSWIAPPFLLYLAAFDKGRNTVELSYDEYPRGVNIAFPRRSFQEVGLFSTALGRKGRSLLSYEEIELCYRLERRGRRILYVPEADVTHVIHASRLTVDWFKRRFYWQGKSVAYFDLIHHGRRFAMARLKEHCRAAWAARAGPSRPDDPARLHRDWRTWTCAGYAVGTVQGWTTGIARRARPPSYDGAASPIHS
ncbi:MAG: glycosyltransferase [Candidatus Rokubacteria bacterium]|nr:glycosyltransferase [Candidatus Rokubacteria bacterium]